MTSRSLTWKASRPSSSRIRRRPSRRRPRFGNASRSPEARVVPGVRRAVRRSPTATAKLNPGVARTLKSKSARSAGILLRKREMASSAGVRSPAPGMTALPLDRSKLSLMKFRTLPRVVCLLAAFWFAGALAAQPTLKITTPKEALGFNLGDDYQMANYTQLEAYWKKLAAESDRMKLVDIGPTAEGPPPVHGDHHLAREHEEARSLQGDRAPAGAGRGADRRTGARAGARRQGRGLDRRRPARHRDGRLAAAHGDGLPDGQPHRSGDHALSQRRHPAVRAGQSGRPGAGRQLVHARLEKPMLRCGPDSAPWATCRGSTPSTSATTTTATSTCRTCRRPPT